MNTYLGSTPEFNIELPDETADELEDVYTILLGKGWTDGLPVIPPTPERVQRMLLGTKRDPEAAVCSVAPTYRRARVVDVAINAVMAGCLPEYLETVIAAVDACSAPEFNLYGIQATTNPVAPHILVNGPARTALSINSRGNALGQGWRANATIGRALRLVLVNIGGAVPQAFDLATHGSPAKYSSCCAENEEESPWEPYHVSRGYPAEQSVVTVFGVQAFHNVIALAAQSARDVLMNLGPGMAAFGTNNMTFGGQALVLLSPEHAQRLANEGFTRSDVQQALYEHSRIRVSDLPQQTQDKLLGRRLRWINPDAAPITDSYQDIEVVVVGGAGDHSVFAASFGPTRAVTREIAESAL
jgi:hypothetical protein